jgi:hypothetical protein
VNLVLFLRGEVILDIEGLANLLRGFSHDHVGDSLAADIEKNLDVEVIGGLRNSREELVSCKHWKHNSTHQYDLEHQFMMDLHELLVPLLDIGCFAAVLVFVTCGRGVVLAVLTPFDDLAKDSFIDL